jgi:tRNA threonylcarbamoyladenosine modification (KEOPS) complex  Pcc1 subunit
MSKIETYDIIIKAGETFNRSMTWYDSSNVGVDMTGWTGRMHLRRAASDASALYELTTSNSRITLGSAGEITLAISATDTASLSGSYVYDLELVNGSTVIRLIQGTITINAEVTK